jgi:hypothetical protein
MKIFVHHYYTDMLFQKFFHNVKNKEMIEVDNTNGAIRNITFEYGGKNFEVLFNPEINDDEGIHIIDFFGALRQRGQDTNFDGTEHRGSDSFAIIERMADLIEDKKNWVVSLFRTEKIFIKNDNAKVKTDGTIQIEEIENQILRLSNHFILTDNVFTNKIVLSKHPNLYNPFTNIIFQWNEMISIRWFYDYKNVSDAIVPKYKMGYSVRAHKPLRVKIAEELTQIEDVFVSQTNVIEKDSIQPKYRKIEGAYLNDYDSEIDFQNLRVLTNITVGLDYFLRILPMSKIQICDESWAHNSADYHSQYLSEKSLGLILANVPFVSTHSYPYDCIMDLVEIRKHPFYDESKQYQGNAKLFADFVRTFISDFDNNYQLCKDWIKECHDIFIDRLHKENSMLDMMVNGTISNEPIPKRPLL